MSSAMAIRYGLIAVVAHAVVIGFSLVPAFRAEPIRAGDSITYLIPAENIVRHGTFSRETTPPFVWEPYRTPGYPLVIAASIMLFGDFTWVLFVAALTAGCAAWCAVKMTQEIGGNPLAQRAAGLLAAFLPNSLGLAAHLLTDAIAGHLTLVWMYLLVTGCKSNSIAKLSVAAALLVILQTFKPTFNIGAILIVAALLLFYRGKHKLVLTLAMISVSLLVPTYLAERNLEDHGVRSASLLGVETVREYLQVRYLHEVTGEDHASLTNKVRRNDRLEAENRAEPASVYGRLYQVKGEKVKQFLCEHPIAAARLMLTEMARQFAAPQEFFPQVFVGELPMWGRAIGSLLTLVLWGLAAVGGYTLWKSGTRAPALMIAGVLLFFLVTGSVSHYVGARLRFPADMTAIPFAAIGVSRMIRSRVTA